MIVERFFSSNSEQFSLETPNSISGVFMGKELKIQLDKTNVFKIKTQDLEEIVNYISSIDLKEKGIIKRKNSNLPLSIACNPESGKIFIKTKKTVGYGGSCNVTLGWDLANYSKVVYRTQPDINVSANERKIYRELAARPDLFVATKEIFDYRGTFNHKSGNEINPAKEAKEVRKTCFVLEHLDIDLYDLFYSDKLTLQQTFEIACDIADALEVLHDQFKIVHRDLKLENIFLAKKTGEKQYQAKIADFGQSEYTNQFPVMGAGTLYYCPPEWKLVSIENKQNGTSYFPVTECSSDIWKFGVILLYLFSDVNTRTHWKKLYKEKIEITEIFEGGKKVLMQSFAHDYEKKHSKGSNKFDENAKNQLHNLMGLISSCLQWNPDTRIKAKSLAKTLHEIKDKTQPDSSTCTIF